MYCPVIKRSFVVAVVFSWVFFVFYLGGVEGIIDEDDHSDLVRNKKKIHLTSWIMKKRISFQRNQGNSCIHNRNKVFKKMSAINRLIMILKLQSLRTGHDVLHTNTLNFVLMFIN